MEWVHIGNTGFEANVTEDRITALSPSFDIDLSVIVDVWNTVRVRNLDVSDILTCNENILVI
jgi:hypothetical protein